MLGLTWLGQAGFLIEANETRFVIDLFLTPIKGRIPSPFGVEKLGHIDWAFVTHEHSDHWDGPALAKLRDLCPEIGLVVPESMVGIVQDAGFLSDRIVGAVPDLSFQLKDITVTPIRSAHAVHVVDGYGFGKASGQFLGYCLTIADVVIYHSGDTVCYPGMIDRLKREHVQVALLPINGRDFFREQADIVGNLTELEAVEVAGQIGATTFIPMHYDAMPRNSGDVGIVVRLARERWPSLNLMVPAQGDRLTISSATADR